MSKIFWLVFMLGFIFLLWVGCFGFVVYHEQLHVKIFSKYGLDSIVVVSDFGLHGHTYPIDLNCDKINCGEMWLEQDVVDGVDFE